MGQMELRPQSMGHAVRNTKVGVSKCDTCNAGSILNAVPGIIIGRVILQFFQMCKDQFRRFLRQRIGEIRSIFGDIGFQRMNQHIHTCVCNHRLGHIPDTGGIQQRHIRRNEFVDQDVLAPLAKSPKSW